MAGNFGAVALDGFLRRGGVQAVALDGSLRGLSAEEVSAINGSMADVRGMGGPVPGDVLTEGSSAAVDTHVGELEVEAQYLGRREIQEDVPVTLGHRTSSGIVMQSRGLKRERQEEMTALFQETKARLLTALGKQPVDMLYVRFDFYAQSFIYVDPDTGEEVVGDMVPLLERDPALRQMHEALHSFSSENFPKCYSSARRPEYRSGQKGNFSPLAQTHLARSENLHKALSKNGGFVDSHTAVVLKYLPDDGARKRFLERLSMATGYTESLKRTVAEAKRESQARYETMRAAPAGTHSQPQIALAYTEMKHWDAAHQELEHVDDYAIGWALGYALAPQGGAQPSVAEQMQLADKMRKALREQRIKTGKKSSHPVDAEWALDASSMLIEGRVGYVQYMTRRGSEPKMLGLTEEIFREVLRAYQDPDAEVRLPERLRPDFQSDQALGEFERMRGAVREHTKGARDWFENSFQRAAPLSAVEDGDYSECATWFKETVVDIYLAEMETDLYPVDSGDDDDGTTVVSSEASDTATQVSGTSTDVADMSDFDDGDYGSSSRSSPWPAGDRHWGAPAHEFEGNMIPPPPPVRRRD